MTQELGAPCQSKLGSMIQSRIGSALGCPTKEPAVIMMAVIDEAEHIAEGSGSLWLGSIDLYNTAFSALGGIADSVQATVVHVPRHFGGYSDLGRLDLAPFPSSIRFIEAPSRTLSASVLLSSLDDRFAPLYARLSHDASGSMSIATDTPSGFTAAWAEFVRRAKLLPGWEDLIEGDNATLNTSEISPTENVLINFANAMDDARILIGAQLP